MRSLETQPLFSATDLSGFVGGYEGTAVVADGRMDWLEGDRSGRGWRLLDHTMYRVDGSTLRFEVEGELTTRGMLIVDGYVSSEIGPGAFRSVAEFRVGTGREEHLLEWNRIIRAHAVAWPRPGFVGIVVGENRNDCISFFGHLFGADGNEVDADFIIPGTPV